VEQKMPAVALTDTNGMHAAVPFYQKAKEARVKPILGVVLDVAVEMKNGERRRAKNETRNTPSAPVVLLAADAAGYSNLCQLTTLRHLNEKPVTLEKLA